MLVVTDLTSCLQDVLHIYKTGGTENQYPFSSKDALRSFVSSIQEMTTLAITGDENVSIPWLRWR
jgi:hypothetical protein